MTGAQKLDNSTLASQLAVKGVRHLRVGEVKAAWSSIDTVALVVALARHSQPRFREALIPLFIRHPEYEAFVPDSVTSIEPSAADVLRHMYTAAVYLQRFWQGTLSLYLGDFPLLPDYFGQSMFGLPSPDDHFGEAGLRALASLQEQQTGYAWLDTYRSTIQLLLDQLRLEYGQQAG